jgi:hypothetical protein
MIVRDLQQRDSTLPVITDVLSTAAVIAPVNYFNVKRFKIYYDKVVSFDYYNFVTHLKIMFPLKGEVRYSGVSSSTINKNGLYMIIRRQYCKSSNV